MAEIGLDSCSAAGRPSGSTLANGQGSDEMKASQPSRDSRRAKSSWARRMQEEAGEDVDQTPTKYSRPQIPSHLDSRIMQDVRAAKPSWESGSQTRELEHLSPPRLKHQSSTATIKSSEFQLEPELAASSSTIKPTKLAPSQQGLSRKKSQMYEQQIQQLRSESRLGERDLEADRSLSRSSEQRQTDNTDTSGTEGSGPVMGDRRRKKSSASSSSRRAAIRASQQREVHTSPPKRLSPRKDSLINSGKSPFSTLTSPLRTESALELSSPPEMSPELKRSALPSEFRSSRYRSDALEDDRDRRRRNSIEATSAGETWPRGEELPARAFGERRENRRRRHVSDAVESESPFPSSDGSAARPGRISVDASGISRHLSRSSKYGTLTDGRSPAHALERVESGSIRGSSAHLRDRKVSTSSSISQRSSGSASDLHRSASRASLRRSHGRDVFDDEGAPPLPDYRRHPLISPSAGSQQQQQQGTTPASTFKQRQEDFRQPRNGVGDEWRREVEELQARIDKLTMAATSASGPMCDIHSRSSSRASASASRSAVSSNVSSTPSSSLARRANRPSTEPRNPRNGPSRIASDVATDFHRSEASSRIEREMERRMPVTPGMPEARSGSGRPSSGASTNPLPSTGRFSSIGQSAKRSVSSSARSGPLHERNLLHSVEAFERQTVDPSTRSAADSTELAHRFKETGVAAININSGLRSLLQSVSEAQVESEMGDGEMVFARVLHDIDKILSQILRDSDEQIRSLTDGLLTFTRAERERERMRRNGSDQGNSMTLPRSASRVSSLGLVQVSPEREKIHSRLGERDVELRRSSMDLRRNMSLRDRDRLTPSNSSTSMQAVESRSIKSENSSGSRKSSDLGQASISRRFSLLLESHASLNTFPPSPYSPSPNPTTTASHQNVANITSPVLDMLNRTEGDAPQDKDTSTSSHGMSHSRSTSEMNPRVRQGMGQAGPPLSPWLRRDKTSPASVQTVRVQPPSSLSPRRPRLSFPKVSTTTVNATPSIISGQGGSSTVSSGHLLSEEPKSATGDDRSSVRRLAQAWEGGVSVDSKLTHGNLNGDSSRRVTMEPVFQSLGRHQGKTMSSETA